MWTTMMSGTTMNERKRSDGPPITTNSAGDDHAHVYENRAIQTHLVAMNSRVLTISRNMINNQKKRRAERKLNERMTPATIDVTMVIPGPDDKLKKRTYHWIAMLMNRRAPNSDHELPDNLVRNPTVHSVRRWD